MSVFRVVALKGEVLEGFQHEKKYFFALYI